MMCMRVLEILFKINQSRTRRVFIGTISSNSWLLSVLAKVVVLNNFEF